MLAVGVVLLLCTLGARLPGAVSYALWQDEIGAERVISKPTVRGALRQIVHRESTPPAFFLLARYADRTVSGLGQASRAKAVRALSIAFSLGCTLLTFVLALRLMALWAATLAGVLVSFGSVLVVHGSELRAYSLLAFTGVAFAFVLELAAAQPALGRLALLSGVVALGSLTHYFFLFTFAAGVLWLFVSGRQRSDIARIGAALAAGLIPLAVWSPDWLRQYENGIYGTAPVITFSRFLGLLPSLLFPQALVTDMGAVARVALTLAVLGTAALLLRIPAGRLYGLCVLVPFLVVSAGAWVTAERVFNTRNLIAVAPFAALALAWGCASLPWRRVSYVVGALVGALVVAGFAYGQISLGRTPYDHIADEITEQGFRHDEPIVYFGTYGGFKPVEWYLTTDEPANTWPRFFTSAPTAGACSAVEVIAGTAEGRRWLNQHRDLIVARATTPAYGDPLQGRRIPDVVVARLRWSPGILERPAGVKSMFLFHRADTPSPCLRR